MVKKVAIGVDIGGGSVKLGAVSPGGKIILRDSFLTVSSREKLLKTLLDHLLDLKRQAGRRKLKVIGIGVGAPGPIHIGKGLVYFFPNIPGWKNVPLKKRLERRLALPVRLDNDANAMALAEFCYGAGRGATNLIALTLGTGVGGGLVINGELFRGAAFSAAEVGHLVVNEKGPRCSCGSRGCLETYVGSGYFIREVKRRLKSGGKSILRQWIRQKKILSPFLVAQAAKQGDRFSKEIWRETGEHLGTALAGLVNILNPDTIVLGGGIAQNGRLLFDAVTRTIRKKAFPIAARSVKVVPAALGVDAGIIGAASLIFSKEGTLTE